uniref:WIZ zinc finger n=1 Tax=Amazona collaria TaxID=241587 RepID=A0A8B9G0C6_9PSIT
MGWAWSQVFIGNNMGVPMKSHPVSPCNTNGNVSIVSFSPSDLSKLICSSTDKEHLEFKKALYRTDARSSLDLRAMAWDSSTLESRAGDGREESTLKRLPGLKDLKDTRCVKEAPFAMEPQVVNAVQVDPESDSEDLGGGKGTAGPPSPCAGASVGGGEEKYLKTEPKQLEGLSKEHLEKSKRGIQRVDWIPRPTRSPSPHYKDMGKVTDVATNLPFRGQAVLEVPPPLFRKTLNPVLSKAKSLESASSHRKGLLVDSDLGELNPLNAAEWAIPKLGADLAVGKQTWTVNAEDSVERMPLMPLDPAPCSSYDIEMRPYVCSVLVEEQGKEELGPEEDPTVYTCIECSIYFKKKEHLMDHMLQHNRGPGRDQDRDALGGQCQFCCNECGWAFGDPASLEQHKRLHQESREKIIEEIQKLNEFPDEGRDARLQCPKCVFGTNSSKIFVQHAKMHVKERKDQGHVALQMQVPPQSSSSKGLSTCVLCSFPAPNDTILKEHMKYAHSHLSWDTEVYEDDPNQPGTSRDAYSPARPARFADMDYFGKAEQLFPPPSQESTSHYEAVPTFALAHPRHNKSNGAGAQPLEGEGDEISGSTEMDLGENRGIKPLSIPQAALDLKRTFRDTLKATDPSIASEEQQQQLRMMVPIVLLEEVNPHPKATKRPRGKPFKKKALLPSRDFLMEEPIPLDMLLLDAPLEGPLELDDLLDSDSPMLKNEERKCPYCPDRFHNGIGLANHVRGHLNRVGVSYNVRHFISAEEVKAIEQKFSFQKKKKKVANFDPSTFSLMRCEFCGAGFDTRAGLSSHARAHLRDFGITNWELTISPINILKELLANSSEHPMLQAAMGAEPSSPSREREAHGFGTFIPCFPPFSLFPLLPAAQNLTTCEVCGACFETRKGLSSHARSHLRQLGVAESESSGAPIDLLYELMKQKSKPDGSPLAPPLAKKPPKDAGTTSPRPSLLALGKGERPTDGPVNKAIKSPPGFSKGLSQPGSPILKKVPAALSGSPSPKNPEEKSSKLSLSPLQSSPNAQWPQADEEGPLNLTSGAEPVRDIRCEFCGEYFENRKGLSSHARSHLRQMGVTEWYVNGSPIDTLREILKRRTQPRSSASNPGIPGQKAMAKSLLSTMGSLEARGPGELHIPALPKKVQQPGSPMGQSPTSSPPPTARKMFPGLSPPSLQKKLKQDHLRVEIKREMMSGGLHGEPHPSDQAWSPREDMSPLNLSSRAEPVRDIRCEFCGEYFENRKGLSSHARSHLRQMGVTEWSVNGSPIDTLREILKKKSKPCVIKKEPHPSTIEPPKGLGEEGLEPKSPGKILQGMTLAPLGGRPGKPGPGGSSLSRELSLAPIASKGQGGFLTPLAAKRPLQEERLGPHGDIKHKSFIQTELPFKAKAVHDKPAHTSGEACCELCGLYFENRKALASHARAHLRQFGVTEWCVNGSPIETLSEWIRHRPQKAGAYRSYIQGGRPFTKKFRNSSLQAGGMAFLSKGLTGELAHGEAGKLLDGGSGAERPMVTSPLSLVKLEEHQRSNINKFERRQARPLDAPIHREGEGGEFQQKMEETRQPPPRVRPVPSLVPRPPQTSLVKFVGNIYTLKCRFCEVEFQGPLSIQEEWVRHLQQHILEMNFSKADPLRGEAPPQPEPPAMAEAQ